MHVLTTGVAKYSPGCSGRRRKQIVSLHWHTRYWSF